MVKIPKFKSWDEFYMHFETAMKKEPVPGYIHADILFHLYEEYFRDEVITEQIPLDKKQFHNRVDGELNSFLMKKRRTGWGPQEDVTPIVVNKD